MKVIILASCHLFSITYCLKWPKFKVDSDQNCLEIKSIQWKARLAQKQNNILDKTDNLLNMVLTEDKYDEDFLQHNQSDNKTITTHYKN